MNDRLLRFACLGALLLCTAPIAAHAAGREASPRTLDYNRDIRPILSNSCFTCHGPDRSNRKAGLRLDRADEARKELRHGGFAVVPGNRSESELWNRVTAHGGAKPMPPRNSGKKLSEADIDLLGQWIDQGARWDEHWSYKPLRNAFEKGSDPLNSKGSDPFRNRSQRWPTAPGRRTPSTSSCWSASRRKASNPRPRRTA